MKDPSTKQIGRIVLISIIILCVVGLFFFLWFNYTNTWKYCADFELYQKEFVLVCNYVQEYMNGKSGTLSIAFSEKRKYDLYDNNAGKYLECPENVRNALEIISQRAFSHKDSQFEKIYCDAEMVTFDIVSGPYKLVYSPEKAPTTQTGSSSDIVLCKKIKDGWYHITIWSW